MSDFKSADLRTKVISSLAGLRPARAIKDGHVEAFIRDALKGAISESLFEDGLESLFFDTYREWLVASRMNRLTGLESYPHASFVHGTSQAFDFFYHRHRTRRLRFFRGEFVYHRIAARSADDQKQEAERWVFIEDEPLSSRDAVVMSLPFSDNGGVHPEARAILDTCHQLGVPVLLDLAYFGICRGIEFDLAHPAIETITTSLSKAFYGAAYARIGLRLQRRAIDDPIDFSNGVGMVSRLSLKLGIELMRRFSADYIPETYSDIQEKICREIGVEPSACVIFGLAPSEDTRFSELNRGGRWNRLCLSALMDQK